MFQQHLLKRLSLPNWISFVFQFPNWKSFDLVHVNLFMDDLFAYPFANAAFSWFLWLYSKCWRQVGLSSPTLFFFKTVLVFLSPLAFQIQFKISWPISTKVCWDFGLYESTDWFGEICHFNNIEYFSPWIWHTFPFFYYDFSCNIL